MKRPQTKHVLICVALFFFFLVIRFPFSNLKGYIFSQIQKNTGITVVFAEDLYLSIFGWPGIGMKNVAVIIPEQMLGSEIDITAQKIIARVGIGSLFPPSLSYSVGIDGLKNGGDIYVKLSKMRPNMQRMTSANIYFEAENFDLSQFPINGQKLSGKLTGDASLALDTADMSKNVGTVNLHIEKFSTPAVSPQGFPIPPIKLGDVNAKLQAKNGALEFNTFQFGGPGSELQGQLGGELRLGQTMNQSSLNMTMKLQFTEEFSKNQDAATLITILDNFDKRQPGKSYNLRWNKPIERIVYNFLDHGPEPLP